MKTSVIALTVAAALGLGSVPAFAHERDGGHHEQHHEHHDRHWDHGGRVFVRPGYYPQPYYYGQPAYTSYDSGDAMGAAIVGALVGGMLTQMANQHYHR